MKIIRRLLVSLLVIILLLAAGGFIIAFFYGDNVKKYVVRELNKNLRSPVTVGSIRFSVFRNFPHASLEFTDVLAREALPAKKNKDTLFYVKDLSLLFDISDVLAGRYIVRKLSVSGGTVKLVTDKYGRENYYFWKTSSDSSGKQNVLDLNKIVLEDLVLAYTDVPLRQDYLFHIHSAEASGKFSETRYQMTASVDLFSEKLLSGSVNYIRKKTVKAKFGLDIDNRKGTYLFRETTCTIAGLPLRMEGSVHDLTGKYRLDLAIDADHASLGHLMTLLPEEYQPYLKKTEAEGTVMIHTRISGDFYDQVYPSVQMEFGITGGTLRPPRGSQPLRDLHAKGSLSVKNGKSDLDVTQFSASLHHRPLSGSLQVTGFSDPYVRLALKADLEIAHLVSFLDTDTIQDAGGSLLMDASFSGRVHNLYKSGLPDISATGSMELRDVRFRIEENPLEFKEIHGRFRFDRALVDIDELKGRISASDFRLKGTLRNLFSFLLNSEADLFVNARLSSGNLDMGELMQNYQSSTESDTVYKLSFPRHADASLSLDIGRITFRNFEASPVTGSLQLRDQILTASGITMSTMDGEVTLEGTVNATRTDSLLIACDAHIKKLNIRKLFYQMENFGQDVLVDRQLRGTITSGIRFVSVWSSALEANLDKIYAKSNITIDNGELIDFAPMMALSRFIRVSELKHIRFSTLTNQIEIKNQQILFPAMEIQSTALNLVASGAHTFRNEVDYRLRIRLSELLGKKIKEQQTEFGTIEDDGYGRVTLFIAMTGPAGDPKFRYDRSAVAEKIGSDIREEKRTLKNLLHEEFGWFKKDSTFSPPKKKEAIEVEWGEEDKEGESRRDSSSSKTENKRKEAFRKKWIDPEEE